MKNRKQSKFYIWMLIRLGILFLFVYFLSEELAHYGKYARFLGLPTGLMMAIFTLFWKEVFFRSDEQSKEELKKR